MITADIIAIAVVAFMALMGFLVGFGRCLSFFTSGLFGIIISVVICYSFGSAILKIGFVNNLLDKFVALLSGKGGICNFLLKIKIDLIVYYLVLFVVVSILRVIIVRLIECVMETDSGLLTFVNKLFGIILMVALTAVFVLFAFQIISLVGGSAYNTVASKLAGSKLKLDYILEKNPLLSLKLRF